MSNSTDTQQKPISKLWYKNYMVWIFVIGIPVFVVIACIWFIFYSVQIKDSTVRDDWYMDGKTLYADVSKDKLAHDLKLSGEMTINQQNVSFVLHPSQSPDFKIPDTLNVQISHATQIQKDRDFVIKRQANSPQITYTGQVQLADGKGKYYIIVHNPDNNWRLQTTHELPSNQAVKFAPLTSFDDKK